MIPDQRGEALAVGGKPQLQLRDRLARLEQAVRRDLDVAQLAGHPGRAAHHPAGLDHAAAQAGADDQRHRRAPVRVRAEVRVVGVQRRGVGVVVVDHRQADPGLDRAADVEAAPAGVGEVDRAAERDDPVRAGRPGRVQADAEHVLARRAGDHQDPLERLGQCLDRDGGSLPDPAGRLDQVIHQEPAVGVQHRRVVGRPPVIQADHDLTFAHPVPPFAPLERTA